MKLATIARNTITLLGLVALAAPLWVATGCAKERTLQRELVAPQGASKDEGAYDLGYRKGARDLETHATADYARHKRSFGPTTEQSFATGYGDGFSGVPNRYGAPEARSWMRSGSDPDLK